MEGSVARLLALLLFLVGNFVVAAPPWEPEPGYRWTEEPYDSGRFLWRQVWTPGAAHSPDHPHVIASAQEGTFEPRPGYMWCGENPAVDLNVCWCPGMPLPNEGAHLVAAKEEGRMVPAPGYVWADSRARTVAWRPGLLHDYVPNVVASYDEGLFLPERGYEWASNNGNEKRPDPTATLWASYDRSFRTAVRIGDIAQGLAVVAAVRSLCGDLRKDASPAFEVLKAGVGEYLRSRDTNGSAGRGSGGGGGTPRGGRDCTDRPMSGAGRGGNERSDRNRDGRI